MASPNPDQNISESAGHSKFDNPNIGTPCLSVVMPIYNEATTIRKIIGIVLTQPIVAELIAVDDGSTDQTWELLTAIQLVDPRISEHRVALPRLSQNCLRIYSVPVASNVLEIDVGNHTPLTKA